MSSYTKHLFGIGSITDPVLLLAAEIWKPDKVQETFSEKEAVLLLVDYNDLKTTQFINLLKEIGELNSVVGIVPVFSKLPDESRLKHLLTPGTPSLKLSDFAFFLSTNRASLVPGAPDILGGARLSEKDEIQHTLENSKAIFFQGHAGPFDAGFGKWLILCTKHMHKSSDKNAFVPCYAAEKCFRQKNYARPPHSKEGLVNPANLKAPLMVLDGCCVFPAPGSIYPYETSLLRAILGGGVKTAILSHGVSSTPLSVLLFFLGKLCEEKPVGEAVRESNKLRNEMNSVSSSSNYTVSPWIVIGDPLTSYKGLQPPVVSVKSDENGFFTALKTDAISHKTGLLVVVKGLSYSNHKAWDAFGSEGNWVTGVKRDENSMYLWVGASDYNKNENTLIFFKERAEDPIAYYKNVSLSLITGSNWIKELMEALLRKGKSKEELKELLILRKQLAKQIEPVVFTESYNQRESVLNPLDKLTGLIDETITRTDRDTAISVCDTLPLIGGRLSHLWNPIWPGKGNYDLGKKCSCDAPLSGYVRKHPLYTKYRMEISCPVCSLIGDVDALKDLNGSSQYKPVISGNPDILKFSRGSSIYWPLKHNEQSSAFGYACGVLFDPLGGHKTFSEVTKIESGSKGKLRFNIPGDWPTGLSWVSVVFACNGAISILTHDVVNEIN